MGINSCDFERVCSSCSNNGTRRVTLVRDQMKWETNFKIFTRFQIYFLWTTYNYNYK